MSEKHLHPNTNALLSASYENQTIKMKTLQLFQLIKNLYPDGPTASMVQWDFS